MKGLLIFTVSLALATARTGFGPGEQEWGFVDVRAGAHMFWWLYYTTADVEAFTDRPVVIWLQGGPGGDSTEYGNFEELGPLDVNLNPRESTWVKSVNVLFVDNPVGTGFSYVDSQSLLTTTNAQIAADLVELVRGFLDTLPEFRTVPLYITCESYGGKMTIEFALELDRAIKAGTVEANFQGISLGDSWISPIDSVLTWAPYLLSVGYVDQDGYDEINTYAQRTLAALNDGDYEEATLLWEYTESAVFDAAYNIDFYNILTEMSWSGRRKNKGLVKPGGISTRAVNMDDVRDALGIDTPVAFNAQSDAVFSALWNDFMLPVTDVVEEVLNTTNIKVFVLTGQLDLIVDTPGTIDWVERLNFVNRTAWDNAIRVPLVVNGIIEGFVKQAGNFHVFWVNRSGHMIPVDNPNAMGEILSRLTEV